jgi:uncharacterized membrane protein
MGDRSTEMHKGTVIRVKNELLLINLCSILLILVISLVDIQVLRVVLGLPFLLFFPGYTLIATLFPRKSDIGTTERVALSIAFSVVISPATAFVLNFLWKIDLYPILVALTIFIAAMSAAAWYRRRGVAQEDRLDITLNLPLHGGARHGLLDSVVSFILVIVFLGAIVTLGYVVANPREGERFTEFYILGAESRPTELTLGDAEIVALGIINREQETMTYRIELRVGGALVKTTDPIELGRGGKWEDEVSFVPSEICADTELSQDVNAPDESSGVEVKSVRVVSADHLAPGDKIFIGQEADEVQRVLGTTIVLKDGLRQSHAVGTVVTEVQKVEFRLLKIRDLGGDGETSLSLWVGKDHLRAGVLNRGAGKAAYQIGLTLGGLQKEEKIVESKVQVVAVGDEWLYEIDYDFSENYDIEFSLYKDGELLYRRLESGGYPSLYIWIHVRE